MAADGVREVTLLGQNVNSYGRDLPSGAKTTFAELLALIDAVDGIERIRYTSPHPKDMREDVIARPRRAAERLRAHPPAAPVGLEPDPQGDAAHLRPRALPRPRGDDPRAWCRTARSPPTSSSGFPGETEEDFEETLEVVEHVRYDSAFTFIFSPRRGTEAADAAGPDPARGQARAHGAAGRGGAAARHRARAALRRPDDGRAGRGAVAHRPDRACAAARATTRRSTSRASPRRASSRDVEITSATSTTLAGEELLVARLG